jgi:hypothetical protein
MTLCGDGKKHHQGMTFPENVEVMKHVVSERIRKLNTDVIKGPMTSEGHRFLAAMDCIYPIVRMIELLCTREQLADVIDGVAVCCHMRHAEVWGMVITTWRLGKSALGVVGEKRM